MLKELVWLGDSLEVVRTFPKDVRVSLGDALNALKQGKRPVDTKTLATIGAGIAEIRTRDEQSNQYRVIYIAKIAGAEHVLHAFQKKTRKTSKSDLALAKDRLKELRRELREKNRR